MAMRGVWLITHVRLPYRGRIEKELHLGGFTERELESMYLIISFYLDIPSLARFVCLNRIGCLGYKYIPSFIVERFYHTINKQTLLFTCNLLFGDFATFICFSTSSFEFIKDASHSRDLIS